MGVVCVEINCSRRPGAVWQQKNLLVSVAGQQRVLAGRSAPQHRQEKLKLNLIRSHIAARRAVPVAVGMAREAALVGEQQAAARFGAAGRVGGIQCSAAGAQGHGGRGAAVVGQGLKLRAHGHPGVVVGEVAE